MIKKLCMGAGMVSGFCISFMSIWAFTHIGAMACVFWSMVGGIMGGLILGAMCEEAERIDRAKRKARRKHQIYKLNYEKNNMDY